MDPGQGTVANVLVKRGTLGVGEFIAAGTQWGKVKRLLGSDAQPMRSAGPSAPVQIVGLKGCPETSDSIVACDSEKAAKERAEALLRAQTIAQAEVDDMAADECVSLPLLAAFSQPVQSRAYSAFARPSVSVTQGAPSAYCVRFSS